MTRSPADAADAALAAAAALPRLAVVGHPNKGKSSLVATLARDASVVRISISSTTMAKRSLRGSSIWVLARIMTLPRPSR